MEAMGFLCERYFTHCHGKLICHKHSCPRHSRCQRYAVGIDWVCPLRLEGLVHLCFPMYAETLRNVFSGGDKEDAKLGGTARHPTCFPSSRLASGSDVRNKVLYMTSTLAIRHDNISNLSCLVRVVQGRRGRLPKEADVGLGLEFECRVAAASVCAMCIEPYVGDGIDNSKRVVSGTF